MSARVREETKTARRLNRDTRGRFMKTKTIDLFTFPLEIRSLIYTYLFLYEKSNITDKTIDDPTSTLSIKTPLLRTSKLVRTEALPLFYRHHTFHISVPGTVTAIQTSRTYQWITKVQFDKPGNPAELFNYHRFLPEYSYSYDPLQRLIDCLPNLQSVRIGIEATPHFLQPHHDTVSADTPFRERLAQLWKRLRCLEIYVLHYHREFDALEFREAVAPDARWTLEACGRAGGGWRGTWRSVWVAQRDVKPPLRRDSRDVDDLGRKLSLKWEANL